MDFKLVSDYVPTGDQPEAIDRIAQSIEEGNKYQTLVGVTGSGKTFAMANIIQRVKKPTLVLAHNKTLAAQLYSEFKEFFPENAVEYFVSYYDYYQPEAYVAHSDTYIEKDASINDEIDKLRHSATAAILERNDTIIISSVSCIYGLGDPIDYEILEIFTASNDEKAIRIEFFGDEIDRITEIDYLTGKVAGQRNHVVIFPASHYVTTPERIERAIGSIEEELDQAIKDFKAQDKLLEAQRIAQRTKYDIEMLREIGFCQGIENYSRHITGRAKGEKPYTLMDFFPEDYLIIVDESHVTIPQVRGMYAGDRSRKKSLIENGFRLESAYDNRPLNFEEFESNIHQVLFTTATPGPYEMEHTEVFAEQIIRPTGLLDPTISVRPVENQIDDLIVEINKNVEKGERVLITTLTKKMSEDLTKYLLEAGIKVKYMHSDIVTLERTEIIRDLRLGKFDVLVGINLLREGLDIPEVSLVAILDADKEGFLRSETSMIQTIGRAARNANGRVIMYADRVTDSMQRAISETERRRSIQIAYNEKHGIVPKTIQKGVRDSIEATKIAEEVESYDVNDIRNLKDEAEISQAIIVLKSEMMAAAENLEFEKAAELRDKIMILEKKL